MYDFFLTLIPKKGVLFTIVNKPLLSHVDYQQQRAMDAKRHHT
jgi:hypothetical protein